MEISHIVLASPAEGSGEEEEGAEKGGLRPLAHGGSRGGGGG